MATLDDFITLEEAKLQLGLEGATLDQSVIARINSARQAAVEDLEDLFELMLLDENGACFEGRIYAGSDKPFSTPLTDFFRLQNVIGGLYRLKTDNAYFDPTYFSWNGEIYSNTLKVEGTKYQDGKKNLYLIYPQDKWPDDAHEDGQAVLLMAVGAPRYSNLNIFGDCFSKRAKEYTLLRLSGYFDSRVTGASGMPLDHELARKIGRRISSGPTPTWEKMKAARIAADRIGARN